jgi:5-methylcytosine-specific restriction enzyme A
MPLRARALNNLWGVGAKHALYREDGKWYHQLTEFPGALFDANGYVVFKTVTDYLGSPYLQIRQDLHVPAGISAMPNYIRVTEDGHLQEFSNRILETPETGRGREQAPTAPETPIANDTPEGNRETVRVLSQSYRIIRDTTVSRWVKYVHGYKCQLCGDTIQLHNDQFYAEAHHVQPLGKRHEGPDVVENVICVCPKHHVLLDYGIIPLDKSRLDKVPGHNVSDAYIAYHNTKICGQP